LNVLERLHVLSVVSNPGQPRCYSLTNPFAASLRLALTGGGNHKSFGVPCNTPPQDAISIADLDEFARKQWEGVLGYMVGSTGTGLTGEGVTLSDGVKTLLRLGGLVDVRSRKVEITQDGFAFILQEVNAQVWTILIRYLENAEQVRNTSQTKKPSNIGSWGWTPWMYFPSSLCLGALSLASPTAKLT
jgi:transcription initiation factor TFIIH subunit 4